MPFSSAGLLPPWRLPPRLQVSPPRFLGVYMRALHLAPADGAPLLSAPSNHLRRSPASSRMIRPAPQGWRPGQHQGPDACQHRDPPPGPPLSPPPPPMISQRLPNAHSPSHILMQQFDYYQLPFCSPKKIQDLPENLGEARERPPNQMAILRYDQAGQGFGFGYLPNSPSNPSSPSRIIHPPPFPLTPTLEPTHFPSPFPSHPWRPSSFPVSNLAP